MNAYINPKASPKAILIVEDQVLLREEACYNLQTKFPDAAILYANDYKTGVKAVDGIRAYLFNSDPAVPVQTVSGIHPDLVLSDGRYVNAAGKDGYGGFDLGKYTQTHHPDIVFIMVSGSDLQRMPPDVKAFCENVPFFAKPVRYDLLNDTLESIFNTLQTSERPGPKKAGLNPETLHR